MNELERCPFCGAMPQCGVVFQGSSGTEINLAAIVECTECGTSKRVIFTATKNNGDLVPFLDYEKAFENVVKMWNRRIK